MVAKVIKSKSDNKPLSIFLSIIILITISSIYYLSNQYNKVKEQAFQELSNISSLKAEAIINFINEEKFKLNHLINSDFFISKFVSLLENKSSISEIYNFLYDVKALKHLEDIIFINPNGKIIFSFEIPNNEIDTITLKSFSRIDSPFVWIDIFKEKKAAIVYAFQYPLYYSKNGTKKLIGYIRFQYDALNTLIPRIEHFEPFTSREILLLKNEGREIIYLSYFKKLAIKPLNLRETISDINLLDQLQKKDPSIYFEGLDYSGTPILAVLERIPHTNWILMTKQNRSEIFSNFKYQSYAFVSILLLSSLILGSASILLINRVRNKQAAREIELEKSKSTLEKELELISSKISDAVFILNFNGEIIKVNKSVEKIYGYKAEEIIGKTIDIISLLNEKSELYERFNKIEQFENYIYEALHKKKDGTLFEVEVNASSFNINGEKFLIGSVRDISERKKAIKEFERKLEVERFLTEIVSEMINLNLENFENDIIKIFNRLADFIKVELIRVFLKDNNTNLFNCEIEWRPFGLKSFKEQLQFLDIEQEFPFLHSIISRGNLFKCSDVDLMNANAANEKKELKRQGIRSFLWKPLRFKGELKGFISFLTSRSNKNWSNEDELIINIFSETFLNTLHKIDFEREISNSEKKFRKLIENASDVILIVSKDFKNIYVSPTVKNILGYSAEERINQSPFNLIHPDDFETVQLAINSIPNLGDKETIQLRAKHKLGNYIWIEATITNLIDDPLVNGYVVNYHDITETKYAYLELQESEERYRLLAEESGDVLYKLNYSTMKYEYLSPTIKKLTGYTPEEINQIGFRNIVEEIYLLFDPKKSKDEIEESRIKGETGEYLADYKIRTKDGGLKWIRDHSFPLFDKEGKLYGSIGILTDITELKKREDEIIKREIYLETLVEIQKSLIFLQDLREFYNYMLPKLGKISNASRSYVFENTIDKSGKLVMSQIAEWCNEGVTPQIGNPELQNLPYDVLGFDLVQEFLSKGYWSAIIKKLPEPIKTILEKQQIVSILLIPIFIQDEFFGFIGFDDCFEERVWTQAEIDILMSSAASIALAIESKRKQDEIIRTKDEIIEANRLKSGFLSILSHEIRTPLNSIMGYNEVLQERYLDPNDEELKSWFEAIRNNSYRLLHTINQLIEISKLNAGALEANIQNLDLKKYIIQTCHDLKIKAKEKKLNLIYKLPEEDLIIMADDYCLHGILENIVMNAIKYSEKGTIEVSAFIDNGWVEMRVRDEGIGISEEYLKHLFKPFSQEDVSYKRKYEGTGLGLSITKKYVELIGASIRVESEKGIGTTVIVRFRRAS